MNKQPFANGRCKREQWPRWLDLFKDVPAINKLSFEQHLQDVSDTAKKLEIGGVIVHEMELDIDDYLGWLKTSGRTAAGDYRSEFARHLFEKGLTTTGVYHAGKKVRK